MTPDRDDNGRFKKGYSGNPNGRPKRDVEQEYLDAVIGACPLSRWKVIVKKAVEQAERGNPVARKWLSDYLVPPIQRLEHSGEGGGPLLIEYVNDWRQAGSE